MKPITIIENDKVGLLADIAYILAKNKINIETINVNVVCGKAIIGLTTNDPKKAADVLYKGGYKNINQDYFVIRLEDKSGELNRIASLLSQSKINITNVHLLARDGKQTIIALSTDKIKKAREVLKGFFVENEG